MYISPSAKTAGTLRLELDLQGFLIHTCFILFTYFPLVRPPWPWIIQSGPDALVCSESEI